MQAWVFDKRNPLGKVLCEQGALAHEDHDAIESLVRRHHPDQALESYGKALAIREEKPIESCVRASRRANFLLAAGRRDTLMRRE